MQFRKFLVFKNILFIILLHNSIPSSGYTPGFVDPEFKLDIPFNIKFDIYSLGVILHFMINFDKE
jgi:hypothetical protein